MDTNKITGSIGKKSLLRLSTLPLSIILIWHCLLPSGCAFPVGNAYLTSGQSVMKTDRQMVRREPFAQMSKHMVTSRTDSEESTMSLPHSIASKESGGRRKFIDAILLNTLTTAAMVTSISSGPLPALAFENEYPINLDFKNGDTSRDLEAVRKLRIAATKEKTKKVKEDLSSTDLTPKSTIDFVGSAVWGGALWLLSGSRSNPLVTPLANLLYNKEEEQWLQDRNEGLFAEVPPVLLTYLAIIFFFLGILTDRLILLLAEGDPGTSLQLASTTFIGGAFFELGRIATGEKKKSRQDYERDNLLREEFDEFAQKRLIPGGNCHRSEVTKAFRRYFAKYRRVDNPEFPLVDLEIERLLRDWNRSMGNGEMSSAGFCNGIQIDEQADVFKSI